MLKSLEVCLGFSARYAAFSQSFIRYALFHSKISGFDQCGCTALLLPYTQFSVRIYSIHSVYLNIVLRREERGTRLA